jgi:hypothetical protein|tara:strand:+ start:7680 stop:8369 length:690 start_codon:yes stop_codon:yes gene_type:complete
LNFSAINYNDLHSQLLNLKVVVPPRGKGRTTEHCEQWQIYHLLIALLKINYCTIPFSLKKRERPDFEILNGESSIGVEATEIISPDHARALTLPEGKKESSVIDPSLFKWGHDKYDLNDLREIVSREKLTGSGWVGNSVEDEFAQSLLDTINIKHNKFINGFKRYNENFLLAYHNAPTPDLDFDLSITLINSTLENYWGNGGFEKIIVHKYTTLLIFSETECIKVENIS